MKRIIKVVKIGQENTCMRSNSSLARLLRHVKKSREFW
jgi:hypothetical protein